VIACHYNCPAFFTKKYNPVNEMKFKENVEALNIQCCILHINDSVELNDG